MHIPRDVIHLPLPPGRRPHIPHARKHALAETGAKLYSDAFDKINLTSNDEAKKIAQFYFDLQKGKVVRYSRERRQ